MSQPSSLPPASPPPTGGGGFLQPYQSDNSAEYAPLATYSVIAAGSVGIDLVRELGGGGERRNYLAVS